jgi:hypothetical protein
MLIKRLWKFVNFKSEPSCFDGLLVKSLDIFFLPESDHIVSNNKHCYKSDVCENNQKVEFFDLLILLRLIILGCAHGFNNRFFEIAFRHQM